MKTLDLRSDVNWINAVELEEKPEGMLPLRFSRALIESFDNSSKRAVAAMQTSLICELPLGVRRAEFLMNLLASDGYGFVGECYIGPFKHLPNILFTTVGETYRLEVEVPEWIENETIRFHFPTHCTLVIQSIRVEGEKFSLPAPSRKKRWVVHGDSITQGANCSTPRLAWPDMVARELDWEVVNLGIGGFGVFDPRVAEYVASLSRDFISIHCGANLNGKEDHRERIRQFLSIVLENGSGGPCIVVTPIVCLTRRVQPIRDQIREVVESFGVPNLWCVDGLSVVDQPSALNSDGLHLNDWGEISYYRSIVREFNELNI